jgi:hypothetical protein
LLPSQAWFCFEALLRLDILSHQDGKLSRQVLRQRPGFADWFAVSALFHEIPPLCPKAYEHYRQNREKLTEGIVDLVTNKWLSPDIIAEKLKRS